MAANCSKSIAGLNKTPTPKFLQSMVHHLAHGVEAGYKRNTGAAYSDDGFTQRLQQLKASMNPHKL